MSGGFITNVSFPKTLQEVEYFLVERGRYDVETVLSENCVEWTSPRDAFEGEPVYFMHSKTSIDTIRHLKRVLENGFESVDGSSVDFRKALEKGEKLYNRYGGCVFARGVVCGDVVEDNVACRDNLHWQSVHYAPINRIEILEKPIRIDAFRDFITVSRTGAITRLDENQVGAIGLAYCGRMMESFAGLGWAICALPNY